MLRLGDDHAHRRAPPRLAPLTLVLAGLSACASTPAPAPTQTPATSTITVGAGEYAKAFQAAKDALRSVGFTLDRIDARAGVITTLQATSAGLATPWSRLDATFAQRLERTVVYERLRARVAFTPVAADDNDAWNPARFAQGAVADVRVELSAAPRPGLRVSPVSPRLASVARSGSADSEESDSIRDALFEGDLAREDAALSSRIARAIAAALSGGGVLPPSPPPPDTP